MILKELLLLNILTLTFHVVIGCKKETTCSTRRICYCFINLRINHFYDCLDKCSWSKVLTCSTLFILTILFKNSLIDSTLKISFHHIPLLRRYHFNNLCKHNRLINFVSCSCKNCSNDAFTLRKFL